MLKASKHLKKKLVDIIGAEIQIFGDLGEYTIETAGSKFEGKIRINDPFYYMIGKYISDSNVFRSADRLNNLLNLVDYVARVGRSLNYYDPSDVMHSLNTTIGTAIIHYRKSRGDIFLGLEHDLLFERNSLIQRFENARSSLIKKLDDEFYRNTENNKFYWVPKDTNGIFREV